MQLVIVPLNDTLIRLIGQPESDDYDERIFKVPLYDTCNRYLGKWVKLAGIKKKNIMALRTPQFCSECPEPWSQHQDGIKSSRPHIAQNDGTVSPCR